MKYSCKEKDLGTTYTVDAVVMNTLRLIIVEDIVLSYGLGYCVCVVRDLFGFCTIFNAYSRFSLE